MEVWVRTAIYVGALLLLGAGFFTRWIGPDLVRRAAREPRRSSVGRDSAVRMRLWMGLSLGALLVVLGSLADAAGALMRAVGTYDPGVLLTYLLETRHGNAVLIRIVLTTLLLVVGLDAPRAPAAAKAMHGALGVALLATFSLTSHAAGVGRTPVLIADLIHLIAAAAWGGALIYLAWLPVWSSRRRPFQLLSQAVEGVSQVGLAAVIAMVATGIYASLVHLWGPPALTATPYGQALLYKVALVCLVFAIAGLNRWALVPAIRGTGRDVGAALGRIGWMVKAESLILVTVLAMTALLTSRPVPERPASLAGVTTVREQIGSWRLNGSLTPRVPDGLNLAFSITDEGGAAPADLEVTLVLTMLDHPMSPVERRLAPQTPGVYRAALPLPMAGRWQLAIRTPSGTVRVAILARAAEASGGWRLEWRALAPGILALLAGAGYTLFATRRVGLAQRAVRQSAIVGALFMIAGIVLLVRSQLPAAPPPVLRVRENPVPAGPQSLARGREIYRTHCQACHGIAGGGDGPAAAALPTRPADLRSHMSAGHTDGELFNWISEGMEGTPMPAFRDRIVEEDRWNVLNYIRTFAAPSDR